MIRNPVRHRGEAKGAAPLLSTVLVRNPEFFTNCSLIERRDGNNRLIFSNPMFYSAIRRGKKLRQINQLTVRPLQYLQHKYREIVMKSIGELVCISLIVLSFAAILYSVPF
ncbi:hypothetical protein KTQ42_17175|uniref:hypothetical protein n=1 Tax=Noviherbaspirillum sp. L7-7A TaxID=2850560 RepID=UPI001C2CBDA6|nr:hypothetical protein [Noviherbaspirillum sp. L7-7A]MBV0881031.1 hypothetical protein [Noviherbaspirillum sp. L7-7A]